MVTFIINAYMHTFIYVPRSKLPLSEHRTVMIEHSYTAWSFVVFALIKSTWHLNQIFLHLTRVTHASHKTWSRTGEEGLLPQLETNHQLLGRSSSNMMVNETGIYLKPLALSVIERVVIWHLFGFELFLWLTTGGCNRPCRNAPELVQGREVC